MFGVRVFGLRWVVGWPRWVVDHGGWRVTAYGGQRGVLAIVSTVLAVVSGCPRLCYLWVGCCVVVGGLLRSCNVLFWCLRSLRLCPSVLVVGHELHLTREVALWFGSLLRVN